MKFLPVKRMTAPSKNKITLIGVLTGLLTVGVVSFYGCHNQDQTKAFQIADGRTLATQYCTRCHMLPEPKLADKGSWKQGILPAMAKQLGLQDYMGQYFADKQSTISTAEWAKITEWYLKNAPDSLIIPKQDVQPLRDWAVFTAVRPKNVNKQTTAMTCMVAVDSINHQLYSGDGANGFYSWTANAQSTLLNTFGSPVTGAQFVKRGNDNVAVLTTIGQIMPTDESKGKIQEYNLSAGKKQQPVVITNSLPRPVQTVTADFNKDGLPDYVVCGFGHDRGALYYVEQHPGNKFTKHVMRALPGGTQLTTGDYNNDGWPDVICLYAQADEGIRMYLNDHKGGFTEKTILRFPPIYGSSSFQLVDFNHDGKLDILYTSGDNSDYSRVLKPYHGVYIFINQGNWKFKQQYFYHIDGCTKAMAADFDGDGDLDIAAIGFFSDFKFHPEEGFTYLEQTKQLGFTSHYIPVEKMGRWICMDVGDVDGDGDQDIVLGNFSIGQRGLLNQKGFTPQWDMSEPIVILRNKTKNK
ncbi:FG-GAP repeat domain-containing protein [Mucilaginibacter sp. KACC 22063]|uniref:FG-GAP repeat domain-containing protein n=1 Tax=Mucilaginibacter sp. KACC 22063 TaxID=3025666 RepID=UPI00236530AC|nr:VCBS repeat-containing protein [Mucilaginibacter sp. KACC 22063]WDF56635.1 VCBS repeat-containing protein [Mucilaginibacter sp. KACC 22063]